MVLDDLAARFEVSKSTIIKALDVLEMQGVVYQVRGSGIFVRRRKRKGYINLLEPVGFKNSLSDFELESEILDLKIVESDETVMSMLDLKVPEDIYHVKRLRYIGGQVFCLEESFYKKSVVRYLNEEIISNSIFSYLQDDLDLKIGFADSFFRIINLSKEDAPFLKEKEGNPALFYESIYYLHNGEPFNYSFLKYHKDRVQFFVQSNSV